MKKIPLTPDTEALARRLVWFEPPAEALSDTSRFVAYALVRATHEDMTLLRNCLLYTSPSPRDGLLSRMPSSA